MSSLKHGAGYLHIDHRDSPGLTPADVAHVPGALAVPGGSVLERDVKVCSHCERGIVLQPLRTRDRGYCGKCNHYICDGCESIRVKTGECVPMRKIIDITQNHAEKFIGKEDSPEALTHPIIHLTDY
jgi:ribosomal protein S27AE